MGTMMAWIAGSAWMRSRIMGTLGHMMHTLSPRLIPCRFKPYPSAQIRIALFFVM